MNKRVLLTGGTGFIGKYLTSFLIRKGYSVGILTRNPKENTDKITYYKWDLDAKILDPKAIENSDYIIHLAGESIAQRWTNKHKQSILDSRVQSTALIAAVLQQKPSQIKAFISASGIGIYGALNGEGICTEDTPVANDFLGKVCQEWELSADSIANLGIRTVKMRTGLVLGKEAGFLQKLLPTFRRGFASILGKGNQYMPWIHIHDLCAMYIEAIENESMEGAYNAVVEDGTTNASFTKILASIFGYSVWLPRVPEMVLKLALGEMALLLLTGRKVSSNKIIATGFRFQFKNLEVALRDCIS